jgi:hypothetical protein
MLQSSMSSLDVNKDESGYFCATYEDLGHLNKAIA